MTFIWQQKTQNNLIKMRKFKFYKMLYCKVRSLGSKSLLIHFWLFFWSFLAYFHSLCLTNFGHSQTTTMWKLMKIWNLMWIKMGPQVTQWLELQSSNKKNTFWKTAARSISFRSLIAFVIIIVSSFVFLLKKNITIKNI